MFSGVILLGSLKNEDRLYEIIDETGIADREGVDASVDLDVSDLESHLSIRLWGPHKLLRFQSY